MTETKSDNPCQGPTGFITIMAMMFVLLIMFDKNLGESLVSGMGYLMGPITFDNHYPVWTIFLSGLILVIITTSIRHKFTNYYEISKTQKVQSAFNKELREATMSGNTLKTKKLQQLQPDMMRLTNKMMMTNMKTMVFTMLIAILIWRWLYAYLNTLEISFISMPWNPHWPMTKTLQSFCPLPFPYWIAIYFIVSVPIGQVLISFYKVIEFSKESKDAENAREDEVRSKLTELEAAITAARRDGSAVNNAESLKTRAEGELSEGNFSGAEKFIAEGETVLEQSTASRKRTEESISTTRTMLESAKARGVNIDRLEPLLANAEAALARSDYTKAIYHSKQAQQKLKNEKDKYGEAEASIKDFKEYLSDTPEDIRTLIEAKIYNAESAMESSNYDEVMEQVKKLKGETESTQKQYETAKVKIELAKELINNLKKLSINVTIMEDKLISANDRFTMAEYGEAIELAGDVNDELARLKKLYEDAQESVSFAKLVVANAQNFGANVDKAEMLVAEAEMALAQHDYSSALSKANNAKGIAEDAKKSVQRYDKRKR